jgi:hypothetical protein
VARPNWEYVRVDVLIMEHPKIEELSDKAFRELIGLWTYCGRNHNDGLVTDRRWKQVPSKVRAELLTRGLANLIGLGGGVEMHDFVGPDGHQRSRKEIDDAAEARAEKARHAANSRWSKDKAP